MKIKVAGHNYQVKIMEEDWVSQTSSRGQCCSNTLVIRIASKMKRSRGVETLLHEIGHAIYHEYSIGEVSGEEAVNSLYMSGIHQVLVDNPQLVKLLNT